MLSRRRMLAAGAGVAAAAGLAACSDGGNSNGKASWAGGDPSADPSAAGGAGGGGWAAQVTITPAADTKDVSPSSQVTVAIANGTLNTVTVAANGKNLDGKLADDKKTWTSSGALTYGATYT